ncbi:protein kinase [Streptomyces sp. NPDC054861]
MEDYAGRVLADRYRLPLAPSDALDLVETRAFDTYSGQEVLVRQVPLPEVVDAEFLDGEAGGDGGRSHGGPFASHRSEGRATRRPADPAVRRAVEAAQAAAQIPDHPRLDQVFDVFAEAGSLWIVSELVAARPLAALLAEGPLNPYRAAEIGADVLTALRALHAHGWTHRNITSRTVLVCDDGRVVLTGLAAGAAEEALCGYAPVPSPEEDDQGYDAEPDATDGERWQEAGASDGPYLPGTADPEGAGEVGRPDAPYPVADEPDGVGEAGWQEGGPSDDPYLPVPATERPGQGVAVPGARRPVEIEPAPPHRGAEGADLPGGSPAASPAADVRAARAGAIAAYRAGARAAARIGESGALPPGHRNPAAGHSPDPARRTERHPGQSPGPDSGPDDDAPALPAYPTPVPAQGLGPEPRWWSQAVDDEDDEDDDEDRHGGHGNDGGRPPRALLAGSWSDGPHASRDASGPVPAGGSGPRAHSGSGSGSGSGQVLPGSGRPALPAGYAPAAGPAPVPVHRSGGWDDEPAAGGPGAADLYRGPATRLAAERARQNRIAVVGAVTERWAPEQAAPVHANWRLAPPIGPVTDLWALGALLYRAVQGHAPYPEDSAAELVQLVCAEPPAFAEECGPLRPVVESLLRQDPTERPDFEELRGWLRSLVRSAPEPEAGVGVIPLPSFDSTRLPVVRRRGELVRRRRAAAAGGRHRHRKGKQPARAHEPQGPARAARPAARRASAQEGFHEELPQRAPRAPKPPRAPKRSGAPRSPRSLGRTLLVLILLLLGGAVAYAVMFMPKDGAGGQRSAGQTGGRSAEPSAPTDPGPTKTGAPSTKPAPKPSAEPGRTPPPAATPPAAGLAAGYTLRTDPEGFQVGVADGWRRSPINDAGQVRYVGGDFTLIVVPGRDTVQAGGADPMAYQRTKERELQPWRDSSWSSASGLRRIEVGRQVMAVGEFTWQDSTGRMVFVRNLALIEAGRYHVVQVIGPENERDKVSRIYDQAVKAYRATR